MKPMALLVRSSACGFGSLESYGGLLFTEIIR